MLECEKYLAQLLEEIRKRRENEEAREQSVTETDCPAMGRQITVRPFLPHNEIPIHNDDPGWLRVAGGDRTPDPGEWGKPRL
jgi:hypothetical protein